MFIAVYCCEKYDEIIAVICTSRYIIIIIIFVVKKQIEYNFNRMLKEYKR